jgi:hypothetical protein
MRQNFYGVLLRSPMRVCHTVKLDVVGFYICVVGSDSIRVVVVPSINPPQF